MSMQDSFRFKSLESKTELMQKTLTDLILRVQQLEHDIKTKEPRKHKNRNEMHYQEESKYGK